MDEVKQEGIEEGRRKAEVKAEVERKKIILYFYKNMGFDVEQIVQTTTYSIIFVQTIIDDYKQSLLKKES
ncbi:MAG: hypothetical protein U5L45_14640 [Saprospiraceae bacterium]|nr:hypothetical protein [Saprospiraceae bacterium]